MKGTLQSRLHQYECYPQWYCVDKSSSVKKSSKGSREDDCKSKDRQWKIMFANNLKKKNLWNSRSCRGWKMILMRRQDDKFWAISRCTSLATSTYHSNITYVKQKFNGILQDNGYIYNSSLIRRPFSQNSSSSFWVSIVFHPIYPREFHQIFF